MSSHAAQQGILSIASILPQMSFAASDVDADPYVINCANGTLDLTSLQLRPHQQDDRITKVTAAAYDPQADASEWIAFLEQILPDPEVRGFMQRYLGYSLLGEVREHYLPIATGTGANGKGTLVIAVLHALGDYGHSAEQDLFMKAKNNPNAPSPALLNLRGRRLVITQETEEGAPIATALMKMLTGGDAITARGVHSPKTITFTPSHAALMVTNHLPKVPANDDALWRRLVVIPFDVVIPEEDRDPGLPERLKLSADAIFTWIVQGYELYTKHGLKPPARVRTATTTYRQESDDVTLFLADTCERTPTGRANRNDLWTAWHQWAGANNATVGAQRALYERMRHLGYEEYRTKTERGFVGLKLIEVDDDDLLSDTFTDPAPQP